MTDEVTKTMRWIGTVLVLNVVWLFLVVIVPEILADETPKPVPPMETVSATSSSIDNYQFVLMRRGGGPPDYPCSEPGLERYYDLESATEWVCNPDFAWETIRIYHPDSFLPKILRPWDWLE